MFFFRHIIFFVFLALIDICSAQTNLINNYSFETYSNCPSSVGGIWLVQNWSQPSQSTTDYFNTCAQVSSAVSVPENAGVYQPTHTGNGYVGFFVYAYYNDTNTLASEYIQTVLTQSLQPSGCYYFEMYYSVANASGFGINRLQAYLSASQFTATLGQSFNNIQAQVEVDSTTFMTDTLNWTKVSGYFTAQGGEQYLTIGNFKDKAHTKRTKLNPTNVSPWIYSDSNFCYVYIDDVVLYACTDVGIEKLENDHSVVVYPNPANTEVCVNMRGYEGLTMMVYNVMGDLVLQKAVSNKQSLDVKMLSPGTYTYHLNNVAATVRSGKLMISR